MKIAKIKKVKEGFNLICDDIAPDKSISHRCAIFSLLSNKPSYIKNYLLAQDTLASLNIAKELGAIIKKEGSSIIITPPFKIKEPFNILDCGNAGTAIRLYIGLLSGVEGSFILTGDKYLKNRPMQRVTRPLKDIGANIDGREFANKAPLHIRGSRLKAFKYRSLINSAQVKSALILAALNADNKSYYKEKTLSRDHSERMLKGMGAEIKEVEINNEKWIEITPLKKPLESINIRVPADPSSGFFYAVAAVIVPNSRVLIKDVTLNKTRIEAYEILKKMGADIKFILKEDIYEPIGDIEVSYNAELKAVEVSKNIAWLIDELPALSIAMAVADGISKVKNAKELRVKESDRISCMVNGLKALGIEAKEYEDGYEIKGGEFKSGVINSCGDHRVAMSFAIAGLLSDVVVEDIKCVDTSFPNFFDILKKISEVEVED